MIEQEISFDEIHALYRPKIVRYLTRLVGSDEADDLTQEVFMKVSRALRRFRRDSQLSTWIYRIATNVARDRWRSSSFRREVSTDFDETPVPSDLRGDRGAEGSTTGHEVSLERKIIRDEMNSCIRSFVDRLPEDHRAVIVLSEYEGMKNAEIGDILKVSLATVKIRLHRARTQLRKSLATNCTMYRSEENEPACDRKGTTREEPQHR